MAVATATYPEFDLQVRELVGQHRRLKNGVLHLAVYYAPLRRSKGDIFLFEIISGFGGDAIDPQDRLFEFSYGSTPGFPLQEGTNLRMVLTSATEFRHAVEHDWKAVKELREARKNDQTTVIHSDAAGKRLWAMLK